MNLFDVIEGLVEEKGLDKDKIIEIVCDGIQAAYVKKFPDVDIAITFNRKSGQVDVCARKLVVSSVVDENKEVSLRRARVIDPQATLGDILEVPFEGRIGRIEIISAKQMIATSIRDLEQMAVFDEFKDKIGTIISGVVHKRERAGFIVKIGDALALLPRENLISDEVPRPGHPIKALLKEVSPVARGDYQIILDRASADFIRCLIALEIPEVFEGIVEIKKVVRSPGYKTKAIVASSSRDIDPVGTCVGVGGARIKPILREIGQEKIDLIEWTEFLDDLVKNSLKPAEIDKVEVAGDGKRATVWLAQDQRSYAIGRAGQNIMLASRLTGVEINLQDISPSIDNRNELAVDNDDDDELRS